MMRPAKAQRRARDSDINLTTGTYTPLGVEDLQSAVDGLPLLNPVNGGDESSLVDAIQEDESDAQTASEEIRFARALALVRRDGQIVTSTGCQR